MLVYNDVYNVQRLGYAYNNTEHLFAVLQWYLRIITWNRNMKKTVCIDTTGGLEDGIARYGARPRKSDNVDKNADNFMELRSSHACVLHSRNLK